MDARTELDVKRRFRPYNLEAASEPWSGQIYIKRNGTSPERLCRGQVLDWHILQGLLEAQNSLEDDSLQGILSFGSSCDFDQESSDNVADSSESNFEWQPSWSLIPVQYPSPSGNFYFHLEYNGTGLFVGQSACDLDIASTQGWVHDTFDSLRGVADKPRVDCYMAFQNGTTPLLLTKTRPATFKFEIENATFNESLRTAVRDGLVGLRLVGLRPENEKAEYHYDVDTTLGLIRRSSNSILPGHNRALSDLVVAGGVVLTFSPPLYCEWLFPATDCPASEMGEYDFRRTVQEREGLTGEGKNYLGLFSGRDGISSMLRFLWKHITVITLWSLIVTGFCILIQLVLAKHYSIPSMTKLHRAFTSAESWHHRLFGSKDHHVGTSMSSEFNHTVNDKVFSDCNNTDFRRAWSSHEPAIRSTAEEREKIIGTTNTRIVEAHLGRIKETGISPKK